MSEPVLEMGWAPRLSLTIDISTLQKCPRSTPDHVQ